MKNDVKCMLKRIVQIDIFLGLFVTIVGQISFSEYIWSFLIGFLVAIVCFLLNAIVANYVLIKENLDKNWSIMLSSFLRIILVIAIGALILINDKKQLIAYVLGYSSHFVSLIIYSLKHEK